MNNGIRKYEGDWDWIPLIAWWCKMPSAEFDQADWVVANLSEVPEACISWKKER